MSTTFARCFLVLYIYLSLCLIDAVVPFERNVLIIILLPSYLSFFLFTNLLFLQIDSNWLA